MRINITTHLRKRIASVLVLLASYVTAQGQDTTLLYRMTGPGLTQPSYLYGTFHLLCPNDLQITPAIEKAMQSAQQVYLELDLDDPAMMAQMQKSMFMTGGKTTKDLLSAEDYALLDNYLKKNIQIGLAQVGGLKPIGLLSLMYMSMLSCQPASYDMTFAQMAGKDKKEVLGLETIDEQLAALDKIPVEEQLKSLVDMAKKPDEAKAEFAQFLNVYKTHDVAKLTATMKDSKFDAGMNEYENSLLRDRNLRWIPVIEKAAQNKPTFFAFGAGHLGGEQGVLTLLRKKGYTVTPVH
jgi:uncharacterized protein YbaP (TraB family)